MVGTPERPIPVERGFFSLKEVVPLGKEMVVVYGAWGEPIDNKQLMELTKDPSQREMIEGTGITIRHHTLPPRSKEKDGSIIAEEQIEVGAKLTREALAVNGWGKADLLIVAVSAPPCDDFVEQIAERAGLADVKATLYCLACNGAIAALHDVLRADELKNSRAVITAVEGLSAGINLNQGEVDIAGATIFGNGAASLAFSPEKSIKLITGKTVIVPDVEGVIRGPKSYKLPWPEERLEPPDWYELRPGADELFAFSSKKVVMKMPETDSDHVVMKGRETAKFFTRIVPPEVCAVLEEYYGQHTQPVIIGVFHQPSKIVLQLAGRHIGRGLAKMLHRPTLEIPWVLDKVEMGNVSSATTFAAWAQLKQANRLPRGEPFNITGFGVGASVTSMVVRVNES